MFVAPLLLPVMESSRGPARLGSCTSVVLSLCHQGLDEHKQGQPTGGVAEQRVGQQKKKKKELGGRFGYDSLQTPPPDED